MRPLFTSGASGIQAILDPRRVLRWVYLGRLSLAAAIFIAALFVWRNVDADDTLIVAVTFSLAMLVTAASIVWTEVRRRTIGKNFLYIQSLIDLLLVTAIVHVTGGTQSQFAALYILVIASSSLVLPAGGGLLVALLGSVLYFADIILGHELALGLAIWLQLFVFAIVALGSAYLSARMREVGGGELAAQLHEVRLQAADILKNIRAGVITVDAGGVLAYANPSAEELLGRSLEPYIGRPVMDLIASAAPQLAATIGRALRARERTTRGEAEITRGEERFPIGVTTTYLEDAQSTAVTAIFQDISDQKRLELLNLRAERLEAVAELSASLAHEIRNPLASIRSAVEQLSLIPRATDDEQTLGRLIVREADRLSRLLSEFLDFARVRVAHIERVDLAEVARDVVRLVSQHPERTESIRIDCITPAGAVSIDGDADLLHRAMFNLALNAVQAPARARVAVEVGMMSREEMPDGVQFERGAVSVRVIDDGPGIAGEIRSRLFSPFVTTKPGGTGLGLPVVHRAIAAHRGLVFVDTGDRGTRFTVLLPMSQSDPGVVE